MGEIDDYKIRENIKGMEKLIEYLLSRISSSDLSKDKEYPSC
jgi:hypothetical protein